MFESSMNSKQFLKALERLRDQTKSSKPAALHNGVKRILERAKGFEGNKLDDLINFISSPPKPKTVSVGKITIFPSLSSFFPVFKSDLYIFLFKMCLI